MRFILHWLATAASLAIVVYVVPGFHVDSVAALLIAALLLGIVNATIGLFLKVVTFPLVILTFGLFWFIINAFMIEIVANLVKGFSVRSFGSAFVGAIVLSVVNTIVKWLMPRREAE